MLGIHWQLVDSLQKVPAIFKTSPRHNLHHEPKLVYNTITKIEIANAYLALIGKLWDVYLQYFENNIYSTKCLWWRIYNFRHKIFCILFVSGRTCVSAWSMPSGFKGQITGEMTCSGQLHQGAVSIRKTVLPGMAILMLKIRRPNGRLIFNMEIAIRR